MQELIVPASHSPIHAWAPQDRPREKLMERGTESLTDAELLATLLSTGSRDLSAIALARKIIERFGNLSNLAQAEAKSIMKTPGVGMAKATAIKAAFELGHRKGVQGLRETRFRNSKSLANYLIPKIGGLPHEVFYILYLDNSYNYLGEKEIYRGGMTSVAVDARHLFKGAMEIGATSIVVSHNHPSGNLTPSKNDDRLTQNLVAVGEVVDVKLIDHLIVSSRDYYSYADAGCMHGLYELAKEKFKDVEPITLEASKPRMAKPKPFGASAHYSKETMR